ncbi:unnamed protein product [Discosporangium mesarthrocarpum]
MGRPKVVCFRLDYFLECLLPPQFRQAYPLQVSRGREIASKSPAPTRSRRQHLGCPARATTSPRSGYRGLSTVSFLKPRRDLIQGCFERPTPILLVAGECHPAEWWNPLMEFLSHRGCTVGAMALTPSHVGSSAGSLEIATLRQLQEGVAEAVAKCGLTPPVIVAHSLAGLVCQQYLESYGASGLVLLDSFPPNPVDYARTVLRDALPGVVSEKDLHVLDADPSLYEPALRHHTLRRQRPSTWMPTWTDLTTGPATPWPLSPESAPSPVRKFPVKALVESCFTSSKVRLEPNVVELLVLGSLGSDCDLGREEKDPGISSTSNTSSGEREVAGMAGVLDMTVAFHGEETWYGVDNRGNIICRGGKSRIVEREGNQRGESDGLGGVALVGQGWKEAIWVWYDHLF